MHGLNIKECKVGVTLVVTHKITMQFTGRYKTYPYNNNANIMATVGVQNFEPLRLQTP